jgi:hypothetical protein
MNIKFRTFNSYTEYDRQHGDYIVSATTAANNWLKENPKVDIISWQTTVVGTYRELQITILYREWVEDI